VVGVEEESTAEAMEEPPLATETCDPPFLFMFLLIERVKGREQHCDCCGTLILKICEIHCPNNKPFAQCYCPLVWVKLKLLIGNQGVVPATSKTPYTLLVFSLKVSVIENA